MKLLNELEADKKRKLMVVNLLCFIFLMAVGALYLISEKTTFDLEEFIIKLLD
jgi:hypothetical protein